MKSKINNDRILWVDTLRGLAIVLMIIFHFCYDLRYFGYVNWNVPNGSNWWPFRYLILTLFIFTMGLSLSLAHKIRFRQKAFTKRLAQLVLSAMAITVMSLFMFEKSWIYFGILHFITIASIVGVLFVSLPRLALVTGGIILLGYWFKFLPSGFPFHFFSSWLPQHTEDFVPIFPWLGVMLLGIGVAGCFSLKNIKVQHSKVITPLATMGKHGLLIYLIHQPILFAGFFAVGFLKTNYSV